MEFSSAVLCNITVFSFFCLITFPTIDSLTPKAKEITSLPTLPELISEIAVPAPDKWRMIGIGLGIDTSTLNAIDQQYRNPNDCYLAVFDKWLRTTVNPQWETILHVLVTPAVDRHDLAVKIREKHSKQED